MNIRSLFHNAVALAPMAGAADSAFRAIAMEEGASFSVSEMVSARAMRLGDKKSHKLMVHTEAESPFGIQLFGYDPADFEYAARVAVEEFSPDFIDINMGCPAPKITGSGAGSALMKTPPLAADIVRAVKNSVDIPVTAKIRSGYDEGHKNAVGLALLLEDAGVDGIVVHGRTREQMYRPPADLGIIGMVKAAVTVPVLGNGDIHSGRDAAHMREATGCDGIMVGRGALGNPFIFSEIEAYLKGRSYTPPALSERLAVLRRQIVAMTAYKGEYIALHEARKHAAWYLKGFRGASSLRKRASALETLADLDDFIKSAEAYT